MHRPPVKPLMTVAAAATLVGLSACNWHDAAYTRGFTTDCGPAVSYTQSGPPSVLDLTVRSNNPNALVRMMYFSLNFDKYESEWLPLRSDGTIEIFYRANDEMNGIDILMPNGAQCTLFTQPTPGVAQN